MRRGINNNFSGTSDVKKNYKRILAWVGIIFALVYLVFVFAAPVKKIKRINKDLTDSVKIVKSGLALDYIQYPQLFDLYRKKAFLESRLAMAGNDSIGLIVNLVDSIVNLEINGLDLHSVKIDRFRVSRMFTTIHNPAYLSLFSKPFTIRRNCSTFEKEPVIVRKAPKDTIEAARSIVIPDTVQNKPAFIALSLDYNIRLCIYQENTDSFRAKISKLFFRMGIRFKQAAENLLSLFMLKIPDYKPEIRIYIPGEDLISIFRALPEDANVVIRIL